MRDALVFTIVLMSLPIIVFRPYVGALMWVWISVMNPHRLAFGFAHSFPFAMIIAVTTLLACVLSSQRRPFPWTPVTTVMVLFVLWMSFTSLFALQPTSIVYESWSQVMKTQLMIFVTLMLIRDRRQIDLLIWALVVSLGFYGVKGGVFTVLGGGANRVWGPPGSFIEGNNEIGLALAMLIPLMYYLADSARRPVIRYGLWASMVACGFAILGTHSRGALLAACAAAVFLGIKSRRPVVMTIVFSMALAGAAAFMPDSWTSRMNTIETFDQDTSAMSRLDTWATIWRLALNRPIVGAGFNLDNPAIFMTYGALPNQEVYTAHSIYFQALGEHGFPGLALLLVLGVLVWSRSRKVVSIASARPELDWAVRLARMIQVSVVVFAVGGAFLGLLHFDLPYYLAALIVLLEVEVRRHTAEQDNAQPDPIVNSREMSSV